MLIEKDVIEQAKEKLGNRNADLIAEYLHLENYDKKNLKACCPYHKEDTASFIYNKKNYTFHCFGCQRTVDLIDVLKDTGMTFIQAAEKLFEYSETEYSFGEHRIKTKPQYRYPKETPILDKEYVYKYFEKRGISRSTVDYLDIREDHNHNCVLNYYDLNDVLTLVKYRPSHAINKEAKENKSWCQKDADTAPLLFNMNRINPLKPLLITEGEPDTAAAIDAGYKNSVSVPFGAGNFTWIEENWEWLDQFSTIIICSDNDEAGIKMRKECIYRLGTWRTKYIEIPTRIVKDGKSYKTKDLNDAYFLQGSEYVLNLINGAKDSPSESVIDFSEIKDIDLSEIDGIYSGIEELDHELMRFFYGTLNILSGTNGSGKSSFLSQLICQSVQQNKPVWLYSRELQNHMQKNWIDCVFAGPTHMKEFTDSKGSVYYRVSEKARIAIDEYYRNQIHFYKDGYKNNLDNIEASMVESVRKFGKKLFILDNLTAINFDCGENEKWQKQVDLINFCIDFSKMYNVVVFLVIHPKKLETMRRMTKFDVQGLGSIVDLAHRLITLYRVTPTDKKGIPKSNGKGWYKEPVECDVILDVLKDRMRGRENLSINLDYDKPSRRFYMSAAELNFKYDWEKYGNKLASKYGIGI